MAHAKGNKAQVPYKYGTDNMRWRGGEMSPIILTPAMESEIHIGDLVYLENEEACPAVDMPDKVEELVQQMYFHDRFAGVAMQSSMLGDMTPIRIATTGLFEFDCVSEYVKVGDLMGLVGTPDGMQTYSHTLQVTTFCSRAIGRSQAKLTPAGKVCVEIVSTIARGGPQPVAKEL